MKSCNAPDLVEQHLVHLHDRLEVGGAQHKLADLAVGLGVDAAHRVATMQDRHHVVAVVLVAPTDWIVHGDVVFEFEEGSSAWKRGNRCLKWIRTK